MSSPLAGPPPVAISGKESMSHALRPHTRGSHTRRRAAGLVAASALALTVVAAPAATAAPSAPGAAGRTDDGALTRRREAGWKGELTDGLMDAGGYTDFGLTLDTGFALEQAGDKSGVASINRAFQPVLGDYITGDAFGDAGSTTPARSPRPPPSRASRAPTPRRTAGSTWSPRPWQEAGQHHRADRGPHRGQVRLRRLRQHPGPVVRRPRPHRGQVAARRRRRRVPPRPAVHLRLLPPGPHQGQDRRRAGLRRGPGRLRA